MIITLTAAAGMFALISVVAALLAVQAEDRAQVAWKRCAASLDIIREHAKKSGISEMSAGTNPYRSLGPRPDAAVVEQPVFVAPIYVKDVSVSETDGKLRVRLSKDGNEDPRTPTTNRENSTFIECDRFAAPSPGDELELVIRRKTT